jgi:hypothetical protein
MGSVSWDEGGCKYIRSLVARLGVRLFPLIRMSQDESKRKDIQSLASGLRFRLLLLLTEADEKTRSSSGVKLQTEPTVPSHSGLAVSVLVANERDIARVQLFPDIGSLEACILLAALERSRNAELLHLADELSGARLRLGCGIGVL